MKKLTLIAAVAGLSLLAGCSEEHGSTQCTQAPQSEWLNANDFQAQLLNSGYKINEFKVTGGNCYEIYGFEADGTKVEIYFNPTDGSIVKREEE
ncbi:MAG: PepSY domain-containing protein [Halieaceae bacterium]|nr:PepSY domain-containing protein [Halieaceae bacterium]